MGLQVQVQAAQRAPWLTSHVGRPWAMGHGPEDPLVLSVCLCLPLTSLAGLSPAYSTRYTHCTRPPALHTRLNMNKAKTKTKNKNKRASPAASAWLANRGRQGIAYSWWIIMAPFTTLSQAHGRFCSASSPPRRLDGLRLQ
jgi:hypothetical protein